MIPLAAALLPEVPGLIVGLVNLWKKSNPEVALEEWLLTLEENSFEDRKRAACVRLGVPYSPPAAPAGTPPKTKATARDIVDAAISGQIPDWFSAVEREAVAKNL